MTCDQLVIRPMAGFHLIVPPSSLHQISLNPCLYLSIRKLSMNDFGPLLIAIAASLVLSLAIGTRFLIRWGRRESHNHPSRYFLL